MTSHSAFPGSFESDHERAARAVLPAGVGSLVIACVFSIVWANSTDEWIVEVALEVVVAAVVFGVVVPRGLRHDSAGGRALVLGVLAVLLVPAFWSGLPLILGVGASLLGYAGKRAAEGSGKSTAALVLGLLAVAAYAAIYLGNLIANGLD